MKRFTRWYNKEKKIAICNSNDLYKLKNEGYIGLPIDKLAEYEDEAERREEGCIDCNCRLPYCYTESGVRKTMNYCATCGRKLV